MLTVAIVGRPNVGKSTLFNRLAGKRLALVDDTPGVTRDRREAEGGIADLRFKLVDTAGFEESTGDNTESRMRRQTEKAIAQADVCLLMFDARVGVTPLDSHFANILRKSRKPVLLLANKCESNTGKAGLYDAFELGIGDPIAISAEHGEGLGDLYDALKPFAALDQHKTIEITPEDQAEFDPANAPLKIAIVGRPNVGKSTLINQLIGEERMLTGPEAGLTRDAIGIEWQWRGQAIKLFDTAGLRKQARVTDKLERLSVADAKRAIDFAEVVILVMDAATAFGKQDLHIADLVTREGRPLVIAINKWDVIKEQTAYLKELRLKLGETLPQIQGVPLITLSALTGKGVEKILPAAAKVYATWNRRISTAALNRWLAVMIEKHPPPAVQGRRIKLRYMTQVHTRPPSFALFSTRASALPDSYSRYLINGLRTDFKLPGVPIRLHIRARENPFAAD